MACTVTGTLSHPSGELYSGIVRFVPSDPRAKAIGADLVTAQPKEVTVSDGVLSVSLNAGSYQVTLGDATPLRITVPASGSADIISITSSGVGTVQPAEVGIPVGGTDGQVLTKQSGDDYDADWENPAAAGQVTSVAGRTGAVVLAKADVGLGNVDNTSDANKPVSSATTAALAGKADSTHTHAQADVTGLVSDLAAKAAAVHAHELADVNGLNTALSSKSERCQIDAYTTPGSYTWTKPAGARFVQALVVGGGGGGGSGRCAASGARSGGSGGNAGPWNWSLWLADSMPYTCPVVVATGGDGGLGVGPDNNGNNGLTGTQGRFHTLKAFAGLNGNAGTTTTAAAPSNPYQYLCSYQGGGGGTGNSASAGASASNSVSSGSGGGGGGGVNASGTEFAGGDSPSILTSFITFTGGTGGAAGGGSGTSPTNNTQNYLGKGGGGGGGSATGIGGIGADGGLYGGGGGGGGAGTTQSGAGGNGAQGIVVVITWF